MTNITGVGADRCMGCGACTVACPRDAIVLRVADSGFLRPALEAERCSGCGLCASVCPAITEGGLGGSRQELFALWAENRDVRLAATSGGAALAISLAAIERGVPVVGAVYRPDFRSVAHVLARTPADALSCAGSKYAQSNFAAGVGALRQQGTGQAVVVGTPCQIHGFRNLRDRRLVDGDFNLVDFFCHGVPSYHLWWAFLDYLRTRVGEVQYLNLRHKARGWHQFQVKALGAKGAYAVPFDHSDFGRLYLSNYALQPACYRCRYRAASAADLRVGDFWGEAFAGDPLGTSIGLTFTERGRDLITVTPGLRVRSVPFGQLAKSQPAVNKARLAEPRDNEIVQQRLSRGEGLHKVYQQACGGRYLRRALLQAPRRAGKLLIPHRFRETLQRLLRATAR